MDEKSKIPWGDIGEALADLLRHEGQKGPYEHASYELLRVLIHQSEDSAWQRFLLVGDHFAAVVYQIIALAEREGHGAAESLGQIRELVGRACVHGIEKAAPFLLAYLRHRPFVPAAVRGQLDQLAGAGEREIVLGAAVFAARMERLQPVGADAQAAVEVAEYWCEELLGERISAAQMRQLPARLRAARERLAEHLQPPGESGAGGARAVYEKYPRLFRSRRIEAVAEVLIHLHRFGLMRCVEGELGVEQIELFLVHYSPEEVLRRFEKVHEWMGRYHKTNHDGTILTPALVEYLAQNEEIEVLLEALDRRRTDTRKGRFQCADRLQRELEFRRFEYEYTRVLEPLTYVLRGRYPAPLSTAELFRLFNQLAELPAPREEAFELNEEQRAEVGRAAYEAVGLLQFLNGFRARTSREIVVLGNDRFGRQWFVEPLEEYLEENFSVCSFRVRSGTSTRLSVPNSLPREFAVRLSRDMPHVVIVDGCHAPAASDVMALSRGLRDYGNWFAAFNDIRAAGDLERYQRESGFPADHLAALRKWHEFAAAREVLRDWVAPGPTYEVVSWAPELKDFVMLGDERVPRRQVEIGGDRPLAILANPIVYRTEGDDLPRSLQGTTPRYFDDPDEHYSDRVVFGFGPHGLETRRAGTSTEKFVRTVQCHIKVAIEGLLKKV